MREKQLLFILFSSQMCAIRLYVWKPETVLIVDLNY